ncbi:MAG: FAD-dependent monooxygenase [Dethiobacteria bacterium]|nr:FAD-dependent monooxygenase [Dethiobacteria bacterium]
MKHYDSNIFDLAVIGAGPAGALAAALAADAGFSTVIVEQKTLPRQKICGGFISERALAILPSGFELKSLEAEIINKVAIFKGDTAYRYNSEYRLGVVVKRKDFDYCLTRYACEKGSALIERWPIARVVKTGAGKAGDYLYSLEGAGNQRNHLLSRFVIVADGAAGRCSLPDELRSKRTLLRGWGLTRFVQCEDEAAEAGTLKFYPLPFLGGMGWAFSGPDCWVNQGVGGLAGRQQLLRTYHKLFRAASVNQNPLYWPLPFLGPVSKAASGNLMLVGDAAGLIEPFSGEGIYNSFKSAALAIQALIAAREKQTDAAAVYQSLFNTHFRSNFAASLAGAFIMHTRSIAFPATLPPLMAELMANKLWFNR